MTDDYTRRVTEIVKVSDGDSVWVKLSLGFRVELTVNVRLKGIDAPETNRGVLRQRGITDETVLDGIVMSGLAAMDFLENTLESSLLIGLYVTTTKYKTEKYGRYLGVFTAADGVNINDLMVSEGHATPYMV